MNESNGASPSELRESFYKALAEGRVHGVPSAEEQSRMPDPPPPGREPVLVREAPMAGWVFHGAGGGWLLGLLHVTEAKGLATGSWLEPVYSYRVGVGVPTGAPPGTPAQLVKEITPLLGFPELERYDLPPVAVVIECEKLSVQSRLDLAALVGDLEQRKVMARSGLIAAG
jgi:hypothetical protein